MTINRIGGGGGGYWSQPLRFNTEQLEVHKEFHDKNLQLTGPELQKAQQIAQEIWATGKADEDGKKEEYRKRIQEEIIKKR